MPETSAVATEHAYHLFLLGDVSGALKKYREATTMDELNSEALYGVIRCQILVWNCTEYVEGCIIGCWRF